MLDWLLANMTDAKLNTWIKALKSEKKSLKTQILEVQRVVW